MIPLGIVASARSGLVSVTSTATVAWHVGARITQNQTAAWHVKAVLAANATKAAAWRVLAQREQTKAAAWNVASNLVSVTQTKAAAWSIIGRITQTQNAAWHVKAPLASNATQQAAWHVKAVLASNATKAAAWAIDAQVEQTKASAWNVAAEAGPGTYRTHGTYREHLSYRSQTPVLMSMYQGNSGRLTGSANPKTYVAPIGAPSTNRTVIALVGSWSPGQRTVDSVTIGGISATQDENSGFGDDIFSVWRAIVPTGTTATIAVTSSDNTVEHCIGVWIVPQPVSKVFSTSKSVASAATTDSVTATSTSADGFILAGFYSRSSAYTTTWTNLTERYDTGTNQPGSGGDAHTTGSSVTVTADFSVAQDTSQTRLGIIAYGAGLTSVSQTVSSAWAIDAQVEQTKASAWNIAAETTVTRTATSFTAVTGSWTASSGTQLAAVQTEDGVYVVGATANDEMYVGFTAFSVPAGATITNVTLRGTVRGQTGSSCSFQMGVYDGTIRYHTTTQTHGSTTFTTYPFEFTLNPANSSAWTYTAVNALSRVYVKAIDATPDVWVDYITISVTYTA
jgi:hypothetical protein